MSNDSSPARNWFDQGGRAYARFRPEYPPALAAFLASVAPDKRLAVDVGCGNGQLTAQLAPTLATGLRHSAQFTVEPRHTVPAVDPSWPGFQDMPPVLATAMMVAFIEQTCITALRPFLAPGQHTVGIHVDVGHGAATPVGMKVTAEVELVEIDGRALLFKVACRDQAGPIGEGLHRRAIIDVARFMQCLHEKSARVQADVGSGA